MRHSSRCSISARAIRSPRCRGCPSPGAAPARDAPPRRRALVLVGPNAVGEAARRLLRLHAGRVPIVPLAGGDIDRAALAAQREHFGSPERDFVNLEPELDLDRLEVVMAITDYRGGIRAATDLPTDQVNPGRHGSIGDRWIDRRQGSRRPAGPPQAMCRYPNDLDTHHSLRPVVNVDGYDGRLYREPGASLEELAQTATASWGNPESFWPTRESLSQALPR